MRDFDVMTISRVGQSTFPQNRTMTCEDSLIAATALRFGHTILTNNVAQFAPAAVPVFDPLA
jgi:predicted nucleic acid-binding protein